jgi:hypothetical protein
MQVALRSKCHTHGSLQVGPVPLAQGQHKLILQALLTDVLRQGHCGTTHELTARLQNSVCGLVVVVGDMDSSEHVSMCLVVTLSRRKVCMPGGLGSMHVQSIRNATAFASKVLLSTWQAHQFLQAYIFHPSPEPTHTQPPIYPHTHPCTHPLTHTNIYTQTYTHKHIHTNIYTQTYTHLECRHLLDAGDVDYIVVKHLQPQHSVLLKHWQEQRLRQ